MVGDSGNQTLAGTLTTESDETAQPSGFAGISATSRSSEARKRGRRRTPWRASSSTPPSSRSTTQIAFETSQSGLAQRLDRLERRAARGDDVLDEADALARPRRRPRAGWPCRSPSPRRGRSGTAARRRATPAAASATAPSSGPASRVASGSCSRDRVRRSPRRAGRAGRGASRSGTCRGSTSSGGPSAAGSRPRGTPPRAARGRARIAVTSARSSRAIGSRRSASGESVGERVHRAVLGVEVDALALARGAPAHEHRAGERAGGEQEAGDDLTRRHRRPSSARACAAPASPGSSTERRHVFRS